ncbi:MAG: hypothetical protein JXA97_01605 [Anaerolineales bacterium]|nr:hypothetical protein [Anaerolineales bacterium]
MRAIVPADGYWFAHLSPKTGEIDRDNRSVGVYRGNLARRNLEDWMERVGLPYHSPHKFRHGHIQYLVMNAEDRGDLKAISENVMHESVEFTDRVYSRINDETVQSRLNRMVSNDSPGGNEIDELKNILARIEQRIDKIQA